MCLGEDFGGGGDPVDAVLAHPAAAHDHQFARARCVFCSDGRTVDRGRHDPHGGDEHQAFAHVARIETDLAEGGGDAAFVAAVAHPFDDAVQQAPGVQAGLQVGPS